MKISRQTWGLVLLLVPVPGLMILLSAYAIFSFVLSALMAQSSSPDQLLVISQIVRAILSFLGLVCAVGIVIGMPVGFFLLMKSSHQKTIGAPGHKH